MRGLTDYIFDVDENLLDTFRKCITKYNNSYLVDFRYEVVSSFEINDIVNNKKAQQTIHAVTDHLDEIWLLNNRTETPYRMPWIDNGYYVDDGEN